MSFTKNAVDNSLVGQTGTGAFVGANTPTLITPNLGSAKADSLNINNAYNFPTADGNPNEALVTDGAGNLNFTPVASGTITGGTNLGGGTHIFDSVSGANMQFNTIVAGSNIALSLVANALTVSATGSGLTFPYTQAFWVAQTGGSDSDLGTSIETPFLTLQHAIAAAGTTPTAIYVVDGFTNNEALATTAAGQSLYIFAPATTFTGSFLIDAADLVFMQAPVAYDLTVEGIIYSNIAQLNNVVCSGAACFAYLNGQVVNGLDMDTDCVVNVTSQILDSVTNDGSGVLNGTVGGILGGLKGDSQISGSLDIEEMTITPASGDAVITATGASANIGVQINSKGTDGVTIRGVSDASSAASGYVGEFVSSTVNDGSAVSVTSVTPRNVTSISLGAGDWDVTGNVTFLGSSNINAGYVWASKTSATAPQQASRTQLNVANMGVLGLAIPTLRVNESTTTTVYLSCFASFGMGTVTACGHIQARRIR